MKSASILLCTFIGIAAAGCGSNPAGNQAGATANAAGPAAQPAQAGGPSALSNLTVDHQALENACLSPADARRPLTDFSAEEKRTIVACANREMVRQMEGQMPIRIDQVTSLVALTSAGATLTYNYRVEVDGATVTDQGRRQLEQSTRATVCGRPDMQQTMSLGGAYAYVWADRAGRPIHAILIDSC